MGMCVKSCNGRVYDASGFLLIEVLVAFFIVCLCLGILLSQLGKSHHLAYKAKKIIQENDILEEALGSFILKRTELEKEEEGEIEIKLPELDVPLNIYIDTVSVIENYDEALRKKGELKRYKIKIKLGKKEQEIIGYF